jgi:hypothetical protein
MPILGLASAETGWVTPGHHPIKELVMSTMLVPMLFAAAGYSLLYLLMGGGLGGAILIFIVAKMLGR